MPPISNRELETSDAIARLETSFASVKELIERNHADLSQRLDRLESSLDSRVSTVCQTSGCEPHKMIHGDGDSVGILVELDRIKTDVSRAKRRNLLWAGAAVSAIFAFAVQLAIHFFGK